jgi:hypothetical protein
MQGFSVYVRPGRPRYYLCYKSAVTLKWVNEVTPYRIDDPGGERKATALGAEKAADFARLGKVRNREAWHVWVIPFIKDHYRSENQQLTQTRYLNAWAWLHLYLMEKKVVVPDHLTYAIAERYIAWRTAKKRNCGKLCRRNTALTELRILSVIMREAVRRGFCKGNVVDQLELRRDAVQEKPELTAAEIALIRGEVSRREAHLPLPERWMSISFEIALYQTFRLRETSIPLDRIDVERRTILWTGKGRNGQPKVGTTLLHEALVPLMLALKAAGATHTCILPRMAAKLWWQLRQDLKIAHTTFHSTRVTAITEMVRNDVPEPKARAYANHSSAMVNRIYQRLKPQDLSGVERGLKFGSNPGLLLPSSGTPASGKTPGAP